jgi:DNA-binding transcriptional LysR family regulator
MRDLDFDDLHLFARVAELGTLSNSAVHSLRAQPAVVTAEGAWRTNVTNMAASMVQQGLGIGRLATLGADGPARKRA